MNLPKAKHYTIHVTEEEINKSKKEHAGRCMVANAIRNCIPHAESIDVTSDTIRFNIKDEESGETFRYIYDTTGKAGKEIRKFDDNEEIKPFKFKLDARQAFIKTVKPRGPRKSTKKRTGPKNAIPPCKRVNSRRTVVRRRHGLKISSET